MRPIETLFIGLLVAALATFTSSKSTLALTNLTEAFSRVGDTDVEQFGRLKRGGFDHGRDCCDIELICWNGLLQEAVLIGFLLSDPIGSTNPDCAFTQLDAEAFKAKITNHVDNGVNV